MSVWIPCTAILLIVGALAGAVKLADRHKHGGRL
jgi:hypothetical protein